MTKTQRFPEIQRLMHDNCAPVWRSHLLILAIAGAAACTSTNGGLDTTDGGDCPAPKVWRYEQPGCGSEAQAICGTAGGDACLSVVCGCDGETLTGCDYFPKPWQSRGICPGACYSPTQNVETARTFSGLIRGCACDPTIDQNQCVSISGGHYPMACVMGTWTLDGANLCSEFDAGLPSSDGSMDGKTAAAMDTSPAVDGLLPMSLDASASGYCSVLDGQQVPHDAIWANGCSCCICGGGCQAIACFDAAPPITAACQGNGDCQTASGSTIAVCVFEQGCTQPRGHCMRTMCGLGTTQGYCGCDGQPFGASSYPDRPYAHLGACP